MHSKFLYAALEQAKLGRGFCAPNPSVGAVAVQNGEIIAEAYHNGPGHAHAEQKLLLLLPKPASNITIYVSLEPCNHWGRTPPCVDALIAHGVGRVVYAYQDPNPLVRANNSSQRLMAAGIEVLFLPLPEIDAFYQSYRYWHANKRPWLTAKLAQSLDGKIAAAGSKPVSISNQLCFEFTQQQRLAADLILSSVTTVNQDDPAFNVRIYDKPIAKPLAILDSCLRINPEAQIFRTGARIHLFHKPGIAIPAALKNVDFHPVPSTDSGLDLQAVLSVLAELGYQDVWLEAGATLFSAVHRVHLVNQSYIYFGKRILGPDAIPIQLDCINLDRLNTIEWLPKGDNVILSLLFKEDRCLPA